jgi:F-type H+-transporting ATPase subunit delta
MLSTKIRQIRPSRHVVFEEIVDPTMLGGVLVESGGVVLDGSLEGQLERMRRHLTSNPSASIASIRRTITGDQH